LKRIGDEQIHVEGATLSVKLRDETKGTALANRHDRMHALTSTLTVFKSKVL